MTKKKELRDSPEWERYAGALLEEVNDKYDAILEYVKDIPDFRESVQKQIGQILTWEDDIGVLKKEVSHILTWEDDIKLIPVMFEEIGKLRQDVEILEEATKLVGKNSEAIEQLAQRVDNLEQQMKTLKVR